MVREWKLVSEMKTKIEIKESLGGKLGRKKRGNKPSVYGGMVDTSDSKSGAK